MKIKELRELARSVFAIDTRGLAKTDICEAIRKQMKPKNTEFDDYFNKLVTLLKSSDAEFNKKRKSVFKELENKRWAEALFD